MNYILRVRLLFFCSLIFYFGAISCRDEAAEDISVNWIDNRAGSILIPKGMLDETSADAAGKDLRVTLAAPGSPSIIGNYKSIERYIVFEPAIPFTTGMKYTVLYKNRKLQDILVPAPPGKKAPMVTGIYPSADSVPENLLKIYIGFSEQMQEGVSAQHIFLIRDGKDTLTDVFLDLQPELWNHDRNMLTLWLNPGRIKRDLIPNREEGPPLVAGSRYQVYIKPGWRDAFGDSLGSAYQKNFVTTIRDTLSPGIDNWSITTPRAGTRDPLIVHFKEPLAYLVAKNAIYITDDVPLEQQGAIELADDEKSWRFTPAMKWRKDKYQLKIESRVEDLAGNNLERLFDVDLAKPVANPQPAKVKQVYSKEFEIH
jgi:hypothetical protein